MKAGGGRYNESMRRPPRRKPPEDLTPSGPYLEMWRALTPAQRLRRAWRLRRRLRNLEAIHDAKTFPEL